MNRSEKMRQGRMAAGAIVVLFSAIVLFTGFHFYQDEKRVVRHHHAETIQSVAAMKAQLIQNWRTERLDDARMNSSGILRMLINEMMATGGGPQALQRAMILDRMQFFVTNEHLKNMILTDPEGNLLISVNPEMKTLPEDVLPLVRRIRETETIVFDEINLCSVGHTIHVDVGVPVLNSEGRPIACLILRSDPKDWLFPMLAAWPGTSPSAETALFRIEEGQVVSLCNLKYRSEAPLSHKQRIEENDLIRRYLEQAKEGLYEGLDYRRVAVLADIRPIAGSDWILVTKIDAEEVYSEVRDRGVVIAFVCLGLIVIAVITAALTLHRIERQHLQALIREERLRRKASEEIRAAFYGIGDGVITTDVDGKVVRMNPVAEALTGWAEAEAIGKPLTEIFHIVNETTRQKVENPVFEVLAKGTIVGLANHTVLIAKDGTERPIADSGAPIRDEDGVITGVVLVFRDQTKEREHLKTLQQNEARLRAIFDAVADPLIVYDEEAKPQYVNPAFTKLFGWQLEEISGRPIPFIPEEEREFHRQKRMEMFETGASVRFETRRITKDGKTLEMIASASAFFDADGKPLGFISSLTDITRIKEMEREIRQAQKMEAIGALAAGIAHDFNNILFPISGLTQMCLWDAPKGSALQQNLQKIYESTQRAADLVQQILAFSRRAEIRKTPVILQPIVKEVFKLTRSTIPANIEMQLDVQPQTIRVMADPTQLHQVMMNLITNAYHAVEKTGGSIRLELMEARLEKNRMIGGPSLPPGRYALIRVSDTGCGIDPAIMEKIFEPYFTTKPQGKGTGLGLAVVHGIVTELGGDIRCESWLGNGTTFHVYLPLLVEPKEEVPEPSAKPVEVPGGTERILLVDDEKPIIDMGQRMLERLGYTVDAFLDSEEALAQFTADPQRYDLIISDLSLPKMTGEQLAKRVLALRPEIPIIICTGFTERIGEQKAKEMGIRALAPKPLAVEKLAVLIRKVLETQ
ncbi:hybrid sensor histidine kinase/response regulator [Desulfatirhabdium butyrativorans]|uniref:hybrid sensor histidine kinase/response regulator n=1 Tax=Desulfatirhabdium butyrativorans TaxID=340467 RepID=UPI0003F6A1C9|nr:PAS domain S-box protein [Desulfatirhabdium butyrativorans]